MAQKTNPTALRLGTTNTWSTNRCTSPSLTPKEFVKQWATSFFIKSFYSAHGLVITNMYSESMADGQIIYHIALRGTLGLETDKMYMATKKGRYSPKLLDKMPIVYPPKDPSIISQYYENYDRRMKRMTNTSLNQNLVGFKGESSRAKNSRIRTDLCTERRMLLSLARELSQSDLIIAKTHPRNSTHPFPNANLIATFVREQLLTAAVRKRRLVPMTYFQKLGLFLRKTQLVKGVRFEIKGRFPKGGGSAGAARSQKKTVIIGALSTQNLTSPIEYSFVNYRNRAGVCSIKVSVAYLSPLNYNPSVLKKNQ